MQSFSLRGTLTPVAHAFIGFVTTTTLTLCRSSHYLLLSLIFFFLISLLSSKFHQSVNVLFKFSLHKVFFKNTFFFINAYSNESFAVWKWKSCLTSELQFLRSLMGINYSINIYFTVWLWWLAQCLTHCKHAVNVNF